MMPEIEATRKFKHMGTFLQAQKWVSGLKDSNGITPYLLEFIPPCYYVVTRLGAIIGDGMTYEEAIDRAATREAHRASGVRIQ